MINAIYSGFVRHRRFAPREHQFKVKMYMTMFDLDSIKDFFAVPLLLGCSRMPALIKFDRRNYMPDSEKSIADKCRDEIDKDCGFRPHGAVYILTNLSYFGFCYNPVSFYYCCNTHGVLEAVIAEINNTPWGERFCYTIDMRGKQCVRSEFKKKFHISPFMPMDLDYSWFFNSPHEQVSIYMEDFKQGKKLFDATLFLQKKKLTRMRLLMYAMLLPLMPLKVLIGIYYQALILWIKKIPFYDHPEEKDNGFDKVKN